uniref:Matrin-type domain-containing protein n=1 Tax=Gouania willdenowi TaxID=441366 RepID=A0A8C5HDA2_GOUWI
MLGKGQNAGFRPKTASDTLQSLTAAPLDCADSPKVGVQLPGAVLTGPQQQNHQLLLTPASLQLAQLQAQLALHRLKLAQGGNAASATSVLNQALSSVNMSQQIFNQLRTANMIGNPQAAFPSGMLGFPSSNSALGLLVGGGFNQNTGNVRQNQASSGSVSQHGGEFVKKSVSVYPCDTDRRPQYNSSTGDGQYSVINTQAKNTTNKGFQRDFYEQEIPGPFRVIEQNVNVYNSPSQKDQWKGNANLTQSGKADIVTNPQLVWTATGQQAEPRTELYNPEEPTSDPKFSCNSGASSFVSSGPHSFRGFQPSYGNEETVSSGSRILQPYQVNDYHAVTPTQLPHQCSICDKKVYNLKDWDQHVKGKLHIQNKTLYTHERSVVASAGADLYAVSRSSDGGLKTAGVNPAVCSAASQDVNSAATVSYLTATAMKTYPMSDAVFSSHQLESKAFLEMAYVEAAQAMVQYYQLTPALINGQKLLIRMSKRYKELQLKKPGKDVKSIIQNIASHWERDEIQEVEHYIPERPRSRSPISHSLSPHSHSPSFTSCSSAHSPQGTSGRAPDRGSNGLCPHRGSRDWSHSRRAEDERDDPWRNGSVNEDRLNGRGLDRRKPYQKSSDHPSLRSTDERGGGGGGGGGEGNRGGRDWHTRGSPKSSSLSTYRSIEDDFFMEQLYKSEKLPRHPYQRQDRPSKRRDGGEWRSRHSDFEMSEEQLRRTPEGKRQNSPSRRQKSSRRCVDAEKREKENATESTGCESKEKSVSSKPTAETKKPSEDSKDEHNKKKERERGEETDEECWYPQNMEELVTVDEVGGEDDSIIEPDLPELVEFASEPKDTLVEESVIEASAASSSSVVVVQEASSGKQNQDNCGDEAAEHSIRSEKSESVIAASGEEQNINPASPELPVTNINDIPSENIKATLESTSTEDSNVSNNGQPEETTEDHICSSVERKSQELGREMERNNKEQDKDDIVKKEIAIPSLRAEKDKTFIEHSIPLGVEFIVQKMGFFCKLCGLFYTSEETAKTSHCRSTVHYRNLQKYLSQLAVDSLSEALNEAPAAL